jgi:hypothetical protein
MSKKNAKTIASKAPKADAKHDAGAPETAEPKKARKTPGKAKAKNLSALDAAHQVLVAKGEPMTAPDLITAMAEQKLWESPNGKTPTATLYAAMLREITTKGKESRFSRPEKGKFAAKNRVI